MTVYKCYTGIGKYSMNFHTDIANPLFAMCFIWPQVTPLLSPPSLNHQCLLLTGDSLVVSKALPCFVVLVHVDLNWQNITDRLVPVLAHAVLVLSNVSKFFSIAVVCNSQMTRLYIKLLTKFAEGDLKPQYAYFTCRVE